MSELIDRQALLDECLNHYEVGNIEQNCTMDWICKTVRNFPTASPWHRVEEEMPEPIHPTDPRYKAYLICDSLGYMHVADYTYSKHFPTCYSFHVNGEEVTDVKYWMPIEPPKEE